MTAAGFQDYSAFVKAVYSEVQKHADANGWIPVYYNLADEPLGDDTVRRRGECRGLPPGLPQGSPLLHGAPAASPAATARIRTSGSPGPWAS